MVQKSLILVLGVKSFLATQRQNCEFEVQGISSSTQPICSTAPRTTSGVRCSYFFRFVILEFYCSIQKESSINQ